MKTDYKVVIIGSGAIGLAISKSLAEKGLKSVLSIEKENSIGKGTSSRSSEVIHSGIYYPKNSLKYKYCIEGNKELYKFCKNNSIWIKRCKKLIISQKKKDPEIDFLLVNAKTNSIRGIKELNISQIEKLEPEIIAKSGLLVESTGIISSHQLMNAFFRISSNESHDFLFRSKVIGVKKIDNYYKTKILNPYGDIEEVSSYWLVNASGLQSDYFGRKFKHLDTPKLTYSKGSYFKLNSSWRGKFNHLVYPTPDKGRNTLGIHLTIDQDSQARLGPDSEWIHTKEEDYTVLENSKNKFYEAGKKYIRNLKINDLNPDYSGIRPRIKKDKGSFSDFYIRHEHKNGYKGLINLIGIDSPGLTSSIAIGSSIAKIIKEN